MEREVRSGATLGAEADVLVNELIQIGRHVYFTGKPGGAYDDQGDHIRAREIGSRLFEIGGFDLMQAAHLRVATALGEGGKSLDWTWAGIGGWQP
jgi:hypothetical protein